MAGGSAIASFIGQVPTVVLAMTQVCPALATLGAFLGRPPASAAFKVTQDQPMTLLAATCEQSYSPRPRAQSGCLQIGPMKIRMIGFGRFLRIG